MLYLLDEGWPYSFVRRLYQQFYLGYSTNTVQHVRDLEFDGKKDPVWMPLLEQRSQDNNEQWVIVTRDKMRQHRKEMRVSPLIFAILVDGGWADKSGLQLWRALYRNWPVLQVHAASFCKDWPCLQVHAITPSVNVFSLKPNGEISG